ncbi:hypothetical protein P7K49_025929 [Saguinus oedipus]|uniref:Uncharacterized protein n=1 Tax=Saguinus oedipus TaxID=9490 RepID=A0ABQ9UJF5_SAGOE|nr:hypothetical protein P7K49_025929 [Saguinus oedipus]
MVPGRNGGVLLSFQIAVQFTDPTREKGTRGKTPSTSQPTVPGLEPSTGKRVLALHEAMSGGTYWAAGSLQLRATVLVPHPLHRNLLTTLSTCPEDARRYFAFKSADFPLVPGLTPSQSKGDCASRHRHMAPPKRAIICISAYFTLAQVLGSPRKEGLMAPLPPGSELTSASPNPRRAPLTRCTGPPCLPEAKRWEADSLPPRGLWGVVNDSLPASRDPGFLPC